MCPNTSTRHEPPYSIQKVIHKARSEYSTIEIRESPAVKVCHSSRQVLDETSAQQHGNNQRLPNVIDVPIYLA